MINLKNDITESFGLIFIPVKKYGDNSNYIENFYYIFNIYAYTPSTLYSILAYED